MGLINYTTHAYIIEYQNTFTITREEYFRLHNIVIINVESNYIIIKNFNIQNSNDLIPQVITSRYTLLPHQRPLVFWLLPFDLQH